MSESIRFVLNGRLREVAGLSPTMTVLEYLRTQEWLTGTKEGCAEGDCGACTVIVGSGDGKAQAINACIAFLPMLDGREVMTVEHMKQGQELSPVQQAMVDCHGSQCGFCTPGFVMSLSALMHNTKNATEENIQDAIAGNLCRCTGYRPIIDAARQANQCKARELSFATLPKREKMFSYEAQGQKYFSPITVDELATVLAQHPQAVLLAGGTDVGLWVTKQHRELATIIYTGNVSDLKKVSSTQEGLEIGAAVTWSAAFEALAAYDESLEELLRRFASQQIRNSGTVGGNIANGSPIGDGPPPLIALGAKVVLASQAGRRTVALEDYFIAYGKQDRKPGEFVEKIIVPAKSADVLFKVYKISKRFDQDISAVCAAFALKIKNGKIEDARIAFGGMAATPKRATETEKILKGKDWSEDTARQAMKTLNSDYAPITDMRASAAYRADVARNLLYRFFLETTQPQIETRVYGRAS